jgi:toxin CcdB
MQFDLYQNKNQASKGRFPLLLDAQADLLSGMQTRVVIPLAPKAAFVEKAISVLMPTITVQGTEYLAVTGQMASIARSDLGGRVGNAGEHRQAIVAAIDLLFTGI